MLLTLPVAQMLARAVGEREVELQPDTEGAWLSEAAVLALGVPREDSLTPAEALSQVEGKGDALAPSEVEGIVDAEREVKGEKEDTLGEPSLLSVLKGDIEALTLLQLEGAGLLELAGEVVARPASLAVAAAETLAVNEGKCDAERLANRVTLAEAHGEGPAEKVTPTVCVSETVVLVEAVVQGVKNGDIVGAIVREVNPEVEGDAERALLGEPPRAELEGLPLPLGKGEAVPETVDVKLSTTPLAEGISETVEYAEVERDLEGLPEYEALPVPQGVCKVDAVTKLEVVGRVVWEVVTVSQPEVINDMVENAVPVPRSEGEALPECVGDCLLEGDWVGHPEARVDAEKMGDTVALTVAGGAAVPPPLAVAHTEGDPVLAGDAENERLAVEQPDNEYDRDPLEELVSQWVEEKLPEKEPLTVPHAVEETDGVPRETDADVE